MGLHRGWGMQTPLANLQLRVNAPYLLLHAGGCEHTLVVAQIRARAALDPGDRCAGGMHKGLLL